MYPAETAPVSYRRWVRACRVLRSRIAMMKELDILGTAVWNIERPAIAAALADILRGLSDGSLCPIVGQRFALADAGEAQRAVMRPARQGKIVLDLGAEAV